MDIRFGKLVNNPVYQLANPLLNQSKNCAVALSQLKPNGNDNTTRIFSVRGEALDEDTFQALFTGQNGTVTNVVLQKHTPTASDVTIYLNVDGKRIRPFPLSSPPPELTEDDMEKVQDAKELWDRVNTHSFMGQI